MAMARSSGRFLLKLNRHGQYCRSFSEEASMAETKKKHKVTPTLFYKLMLSGKGPTSVSDKANELWLEGKKIEKWEIERLIKAFRYRKRFNQALQLSEWMIAKGMPQTVGDHAVRIDLISKTQGVEFAEKYYNGLPGNDKKHLYTSGTLLSCYCKKKMVEKAESLFKKMKKDDTGVDSLAYNNLMNLYVKVNQPKQALALAEEMKAENVTLDKITYSILINIYSELSDIEGVDKVMEGIKENNEVKPDWTTYSNLATHCIKASLFDKAEAALKEMEKVNNSKDREVFHYLISLYASTGNISEVKRVWEALKFAFPNSITVSYLVMLSSLVKLNDIPGARACFDEWESSCISYDFRMANVMIKACLKHDMSKDAELIYDGAVKKGGEPYVTTMELLIDYHLNKSNCKEALKYMNMAFSRGGKRICKPRSDKFELLQKWFEESGDVDGAKDFYEKLKEVKLLDVEAYNSLLRTYIAAGMTDPLLRQRTKADMIHVNSETEELLKTVCAS